MEYVLKRKTLIKSILFIAAPAILEMALNTMLMVADTLMVSRMIGNEALSAVGIVNSIFFLLIFVFSSFNTGAIAMISRSYGEKDMNKAEKIAGNNFNIQEIHQLLKFWPLDLHDHAAILGDLESFTLFEGAVFFRDKSGGCKASDRHVSNR